jgi:5'-deoxynucleotidase YfbR-like HD superfamily hydrolase
MVLKEIPFIQSRLPKLVEYTTNPEAKNFDCAEVFSYLSPENVSLLLPTRDQLSIYLNCLNCVNRWKQHPYQNEQFPIIDNDYQHTLEMLKIFSEIKEKGVKSVKYPDAEMIVLIHDGGEIITDDMSIFHPAEMHESVLKAKEIEPRVFVSCVLRQLKNKDTYSLRSHLKDLYKRYESRAKNPTDIESHLVKFIDMLQGDRFGMNKVLHINRLEEIFGKNNVPHESSKIVSKMIDKELTNLSKVLKIIPDKEDRKILFAYYDKNFFQPLSCPEYGYSHIYQRFLNVKDSILADCD